MWSYGNSTRGFQLPGPDAVRHLRASTVTVVLHNTLPEATSIVFPGQTGVKADGNPAQPQLDAARLADLDGAERRTPTTAR